MKKKFYLAAAVLTVLCMLLAGCSSGPPDPEKITFSEGTKKTLLTYGLHGAFSQAGAIALSDAGDFTVRVPSFTTEAPTQTTPFKIQVDNLEMKGRWDSSAGTGEFKLSCTMTSTRTERSDLDDYMGYDEAYFRTTYDYQDVVSASGTITWEGKRLVFKPAATVNRTGKTNLVRITVEDGETTVGDNPTITDKSGSLNEDAVYYFTVD